MKIHELLCQATEPGQVLTYSEICKRVQDLLPDVKLRSILPSEHMQGKETICKLCHEQPIFEKLGHGLYRVLSRSPVLPLLSIHDKLAQILAESHYQHLNITQLRQAVLARFPETHVPSIIPLDHTLGGACRVCQPRPLLERTGQRGVFRVLPTVLLNSEAEQKETIEILSAFLSTWTPEDLLEQSAQLVQALGLVGLHKRQLSLLRSAMQQRVLIDLLEFGSLLEGELLHARLAQRLYDQEGIALPLGHWAVETWSLAMPGLQTKKPFPLTMRVAESSLVWPAPLLAGLQLTHLTLFPLNHQLLWLKKGKQRIALLVEPDGQRLLGIRPGLAKHVPLTFGSYQIPVEPLPVVLPISAREQMGYTWYQAQNAEALNQLLVALDLLCGMGQTRALSNSD